jgi:hypothetical protein
MTIKQQGGIFGRNPSFNDLSANSASFTALTSGASSLGAITGTSFNIAQFKTGTNILESNDSGENGARLRAAISSEAFPTYSFTSDTNTGLYNATADVLGVAVGGAEAGSFTSTGLAFPSGKGIDFSATSGTGTSELFDDYEEGTWTPAINGTADTTYSTQYGWYTKVGNLVSVGFELTVNTKGTITGNAIIAGLPFTSGASDSKSSGSLSYSASSGFSSVWQGIIVGNNQTLISIYVKSAASGSTISLNGTDFFANGTQIIGQLTYKV